MPPNSTEEDTELEPISGDGSVEPPTPDNPSAYSAGGPGDPSRPNAPNSVYLKIGKASWVSWQSDAPIAVLALIMLVIVVLGLLVVAGFSLVPNAPLWLEKVAAGLGQAALTIVGAIIGATVSNRRPPSNRR